MTQYLRDVTHTHVIIINMASASCSTEPSASGSMSAAERRAQRMAKLQELSLKRNEARKMNHQEVVEEDRRNKLPANFEQKRKREEWKEEEEKKRKEAEEKGEDYDRLRMLEWTAEEVEKWERKKKKKNPDPGFSTYEAAGLRQYQALTKKMKPNMEHYQQQKEKMGEEFYPDMNTLVDVTRKDSEEAVDRLVADVEKQIEKRAKFSRRRGFNDDADIDYINERNMRFNKKAERFYGKYTAEIKQNLERGTAV
ncbi:PREDICTED: pre-mRNA-splicing factor syf2-like isoform X2 [Branchiostoma belcheri]|uniref:Pre-mRNA-splicing factor SYF2 n=1 Tax=Branchiostoma belcheri TaxID=7741 RepID=A0A6P4ZDI2_BRABE|nr:PREDICTED: pre-mRNA-splicing factor syf2-like isoform X2 [Branchiostoma belcheri]